MVCMCAFSFARGVQLSNEVRCCSNKIGDVIPQHWPIVQLKEKVFSLSEFALFDPYVV